MRLITLAFWYLHSRGCNLCWFSRMGKLGMRVQLPKCEKWHFEWLISSYELFRNSKDAASISQKGICIHQNLIFHQTVPLRRMLCKCLESLYDSGHASVRVLYDRGRKFPFLYGRGSKFSGPEEVACMTEDAILQHCMSFQELPLCKPRQINKKSIQTFLLKDTNNDINANRKIILFEKMSTAGY